MNKIDEIKQALAKATPAELFFAPKDCLEWLHYLIGEVDRYKWEDEQFSWLQEQVKVCAKENEALRKALEWYAGASWTDFEYDNGDIARQALGREVNHMINNEQRDKFGLRQEVQWFADLMEQKLRENDHKGGWKGENIYWLWERLRDEAAELLTAVDATRDMYADPINIALEAADVANFAMMIADVANQLGREVNHEGD